MAKTNSSRLARVERASRRMGEAVIERNEAIFDAWIHGGATVRQIAERAGISFQRVHQIIQERR